jgi:hypothetical protein
VLLNVQDVGIASELMFSDWQEIVEQATPKALKDANDKAEAAGVNFKTVMKTGPIAETNLAKVPTTLIR